MWLDYFTGVYTRGYMEMNNNVSDIDGSMDQSNKVGDPLRGPSKQKHISGDHSLVIYYIKMGWTFLFFGVRGSQPHPGGNH